MDIILDQKLAKDIIHCALGKKMKRSVVNFFVKNYHPDLGYILYEHQKYSTNVDALSKVLNIDWLFYNFVETDYGCTDFLRSIYDWVVRSPEHYWDKRPDDYLACINNLNSIILFRELVAIELIKIVGYPKRVNVKWSRYRDWHSDPFRRKYIHSVTTYGEDFRSTASKIIGKLSTGRHVHKIHRVKVCRDYSWNIYGPEFYKAYMAVMNKTGVASVLNTKVE